MRQVDGTCLLDLLGLGRGKRRRRGLIKGKMASASISIWKKVAPSSCLDARQFNSCLYISGAFLAADPVLELRGS